LNYRQGYGFYPEKLQRFSSRLAKRDSECGFDLFETSRRRQALTFCGLYSLPADPVRIIANRQRSEL